MPVAAVLGLILIETPGEDLGLVKRNEQFVDYALDVGAQASVEKNRCGCSASSTTQMPS